MNKRSNRGNLVVNLTPWLVAALIAMTLAICIIAIRNSEIEQTRKAYAKLPLAFNITRSTTDSYGRPTTTYIPTSDGGEEPFRTIGFVPAPIQGQSVDARFEGASKNYYNAASKAAQTVVIRIPTAAEAEWAKNDRLSPCSGDFPRYVLDFHLMPGNIPATNTSPHGKFGER